MINPLHIYKAEFFKALSHPIRLAILDALRGGPLSVGELQLATSTEQSVLSQHLAKLRSMRFVSSRREKTTIYYQVQDQDVYLFLNLAREIYLRQLQESHVIFQKLADNS